MPAGYNNKVQRNLSNFYIRYGLLDGLYVGVQQIHKNDKVMSLEMSTEDKKGHCILLNLYTM